MVVLVLAENDCSRSPSMFTTTQGEPVALLCVCRVSCVVCRVSCVERERERERDRERERERTPPPPPKFIYSLVFCFFLTSPYIFHFKNCSKGAIHAQPPSVSLR